MQIMIVEDEQRSRRGLYNLITSISEKYEVISSVSNGAKALELIPVLKPDVVFTDLKMPFLDGMSLIESVKELGMDTHFVIISAYEQFETARKALSLDVTDYLVKPITLDEVEDVLNRLSSEGNTFNRKVIKDIRKRFPAASIYTIKALNIIEECYASKISQESIAKQLGITKEYLSYLFHKETNETFSKFLNKYRIEMAKCLMVKEGVSKIEVPYSVGFSDYKYFNKVFKELEGKSVTVFMASL